MRNRDCEVLAGGGFKGEGGGEAVVEEGEVNERRVRNKIEMSNDNLIFTHNHI